jgi:hypothetical protein
MASMLCAVSASARLSGGGVQAQSFLPLPSRCQHFCSAAITFHCMATFMFLPSVRSGWNSLEIP